MSAKPQKVVPSLTLKNSKAPVAILIFLLFCFAVMFGPPNYNSSSGFGCLIDKHLRLESQPSPKVILVGGSNVALGVDSLALEKRLKDPVVNMAFGCTVGLRYMLDEIKGSIKPGDLIVVMPEYDFFCTTTSLESNAQVNGSCELLNLVQAYPGAFKWVLDNYTSFPQGVFCLLEDSHQLMLSKFQYYKRIASRLSDPACLKDANKLLAVAPNMYNDRSVYNEHGDVTVHLNRPSPGLNGMEVINYANYKFNPTGAKLLDELGKFATEHGAAVVILPPPLPERVYTKWHERADDIYEHFRHLEHVKALSTPARFAFPENDFFDTAYHLTAAGRAKRTQQVATELQSLNSSNTLSSQNAKSL